MARTLRGMRDSKQSLVYAAENEIRRIMDTGGDVEFFGSHVVVQPDRKFGDIDSIQRYCDMVLALPTVVERFRKASRPVTVRARKGIRMAHYHAGEIAIPPHEIGGTWAMREIVVLHELAHHLAPQDHHGEHFCGAFVLLVEKCVSPEVSWMLQVALFERGVDIRVPQGS